MSAEIFDNFLCPGCREAQALIAGVESDFQKHDPAEGGELFTLPLLLESALACLLSEFDYEADPGCNLALVAGLVAAGAAQAEALRVRQLESR